MPPAHWRDVNLPGVWRDPRKASEEALRRQQQAKEDAETEDAFAQMERMANLRPAFSNERWQHLDDTRAREFPNQVFENDIVVLEADVSDMTEGAAVFVNLRQKDSSGQWRDFSEARGNIKQQRIAVQWKATPAVLNGVANFSIGFEPHWRGTAGPKHGRTIEIPLTPKPV